MQCPNCLAPVTLGTSFCPNCGTALSIPSTPLPTAPGMEPLYAADVPVPFTALALRKEEMGRRVFAYLLDIVPCLFLALLHFLPIIGWIAFGFLVGCYWLLRDMNGASPGKLIVGSVVLRADGGPSTTSQRIMRNAPLAIPVLLEMIPLLGLVLAPIASLIIISIEMLLLVLTGRRLGDRLAGTDVFRRASGV